jgi:hypothetical protein
MDTDGVRDAGKKGNKRAERDTEKLRGRVCHSAGGVGRGRVPDLRRRRQECIRRHPDGMPAFLHCLSGPCLGPDGRSKLLASQPPPRPL